MSVQDRAKMTLFDEVERKDVRPKRNGEPNPWDPDERYALDVELDALLAHAYGLTAAQYEAVLDSFDVMARVQTRAHGRYKFEGDCLGAYRRLA